MPIVELLVMIVLSIGGAIFVLFLQKFLIMKKQSLTILELKTPPTGALPLTAHKGTCPRCGTVSSPKKKWTMAGRPDKSGKRTRLEIGLFDCPKCKKPFREVLSKDKTQ